MIALARAVDLEARALRGLYETQVEGPVQRAQQRVAEARFAAFGTSIHPDATFTLRLTYGAVEGWIESGQAVEPFTHLARMYERTSGAPPFAFPTRWLEARPNLDLDARANFTATTDIIGGNSGSPMVNAAGRIVGLVSDGNIHSIAGTYWFDEQKNRTIAVHPDFIRIALQQVYPAPALAAELGLRSRRARWRAAGDQAAARAADRRRRPDSRSPSRKFRLNSVSCTAPATSSAACTA
jgi:hypothetical protein